MKNKLLFAFAMLLMVVSAGSQTTRIKLTQIEKANTVNGTKANQVPVSNGVGDLRYSQYVEINPTNIGYTPSATGNPSANYAQFVSPANGDVWYIDNEGRGIRLYVAASAGDYDWLEIGNNMIPNSINDSIYKYKYASVGGRLVWPTAEMLVIDSVAQGMFIVAGDRKAKVALYDTNNQTWCTLEQGGGTTALILQDGGVFSIQTAGSGTPQAPGTPIVEHFNVLVDSTIQFPNYPNTRLDSGTPTVVFGPDATGRMKNYPAGTLNGVVTSGPLTGAGSSLFPVTMLNSGVTPGAYTSANVTVDAFGRVTAAANGSGILKETGQDTIVQIPSEFAYKIPFDVYRNGTMYNVGNFNLQSHANVQVSKTYYVSTTGNDASAGTSWATALRSVNVAIQKSDVDRVYVAKGKYDYDFAWKSINATRNLEVIGDLTQGVGDSVILTTRINNRVITSWTGVSNYYWARYTTTNVVNTISDSMQLDAYKNPTLLTNVASTALVNTTPGSWRVNGDTIFVRTFDSRIPDTRLNINCGQTNIAMNNAVTLYLKNINMQGAGIYASPAVNSKIYLEGCLGFNAGCFFDGCKEVIMLNVRMGGLSGDIINYDDEAGVLPNAAEINCSFYNTTQSGCTNCQASTSHNGTKTIRVNGRYFDTNGQNVADVNGSPTILLGCYLSNARPLGSAGFTTGTGALYSYAWAENTTFANQPVGGFDFISHGNSTIYQRLTTPDNGNQIIGSGIITSWNSDQTFGNKVSQMPYAVSVQPTDVFYIVKNDSISAKIEASNLFLGSGAILESGETAGATITQQSFSKGVSINGGTGADMTINSTGAATTTLKIKGSTSQTADLIDIEDVSGVDIMKVTPGGLCRFGSVSDASSGAFFSALRNSGNPVLEFGGKTGGQEFTSRMFAGTQSWQTRFQGNLNSGRLFWEYNSGGGAVTMAVWESVNGGCLSIGNIPPTSRLQLPGGTATAGTAPLKLTSGTNLITPENDAVESTTSDLFVTKSSTRYQLLKGYTGTSPSLDFPSMITGTGSVLTFSDANAVSGDVISVGNPYASGGSLTFSAGCSTSGTVWINVVYWGAGSSDPGASTFKYSIIK